MAKPNQKLIAAIRACVQHARNLVESAKAVQAIGHPNIAYHLATLALEELGKKELYQLQEAASSVGEPPSWQLAAELDHVKKLFWCFYSLGQISDIVDQQQFFEKREAAVDIHNNRLSGLYVAKRDGELNIPSEAISIQQCQALINCAELFTKHAEGGKPRDDIPQEEIDLQIWFLNSFDVPQFRNRILAPDSIKKLRELNDVKKWTRALKKEIESEDEKLRALAERVTTKA